MRSKFEERIAKTLGVEGTDYEYESMKIPYVSTHTYTPDFKLPNGIIVETKGVFKPRDRRKHLLLRDQHPGLDIRLVFQRDNKLTKKSKTRYSAWCLRHGIKYAVGNIPKNWLAETILVQNLQT